MIDDTTISFFSKYDPAPIAGIAIETAPSFSASESTVLIPLRNIPEASPSEKVCAHVLSHRDSNQTLTSAKNSFLSKLHRLDILASQCKSLDAILSGSKHLQVAITVMTTIEMQTSQKPLPVKRKVSPNQNCEPQQTFFSTKK